jgi:hypothetical protein
VSGSSPDSIAKRPTHRAQLDRVTSGRPSRVRRFVAAPRATPGCVGTSRGTAGGAEGGIRPRDRCSNSMGPRRDAAQGDTSGRT